MSSEFRFFVFLLIAGSTLVNFMALAQSYVEKSFKSSGIVPDVIRRAPKFEVTVVYRSEGWVFLGNELTPNEVKDVPIIAYRAAPKTFYTLAFVDPDLPSRTAPIYREFKQWLVVNIRGNNITSGETLAEYIGPNPPKGSGLHRCVFLVYKQPRLLKFDEPRLNNRTSLNRTGFSIENFAFKYNLSDPVFGNFFETQYAD